MDVCIIPFVGGTPSGDALGTTLCNTMLSLMYQILYLSQIGVQDPWDIQKCKNQGIFYQAAGDDTSVHCVRRWVDPYLGVLQKRVAKSKSDEIQIGLGQVIKFDQIRVGNFDEFDFCSKLVFSDGSVEGIQMYRDPKKVLTTKQFYIKKNAKIYANPSIHPLALYLGLKSQKISRLLQQIMKWRISHCLQKSIARKKDLSLLEKLKSNLLGEQPEKQFQITAEEIAYIDQKIMFAYIEQSQGYTHQNQINDKMGIGIKDLYDLTQESKINLCDIQGVRKRNTHVLKTHQNYDNVIYNYMNRLSDRRSQKLMNSLWHEVENKNFTTIHSQWFKFYDTILDNSIDQIILTNRATLINAFNYFKNNDIEFDQQHLMLGYLKLFQLFGYKLQNFSKNNAFDFLAILMGNTYESSVKGGLSSTKIYQLHRILYSNFYNIADLHGIENEFDILTGSFKNSARKSLKSQYISKLRFSFSSLDRLKFKRIRGSRVCSVQYRKHISECLSNRWNRFEKSETRNSISGSNSLVSCLSRSETEANLKSSSRQENLKVTDLNGCSAIRHANILVGVGPIDLVQRSVVDG